MLFVIAAVAMAFAALRSGSDLWFGAVYTFTVVVLLLAVIVARFRPRGEKAFWFGFAVFGWGFFLLGFWPWRDPLADPNESVVVRLNPGLLTSRLILLLVARLRMGADDLDDIEKITANTVGIANLMITLALALCGGLIAVLLRRRRLKKASIKFWSILAGLAVITAIVTSGFASPRPARFFPRFALDRLDDMSEFSARWYSNHLEAMGESSLWERSRRHGDATIYRLLWLPSFHHSVCVRIERTHEGAKLHAKVLDGAGGYEPGIVAIERHLNLKDEAWNDLQRHVEDAQFWEMPTHFSDDSGCDGDQLIVEGLRGRSYHLVDRWWAKGAYKELCRHMLDLTGLDVQQTWNSYH
jgi:hypothetical protein